MPIQDITPPGVLKLLRVIEANNALETAKRTFMVCSQIFRYAMAICRRDGREWRRGYAAKYRTARVQAVIASRALSSKEKLCLGLGYLR